MNARSTLLSALAALALAPAAALASDVIHNAATEAGYTVHPSHAAPGGAAPQAREGRAVDATAADRVVDVSGARTLNVKCGETITFRSADRQFTWKFDAIGHRPVSLARIAPAGFGATDLSVYVAANDGERN